MQHLSSLTEVRAKLGLTDKVKQVECKEIKSSNASSNESDIVSKYKLIRNWSLSDIKPKLNDSFVDFLRLIKWHLKSHKNAVFQYSGILI